MELRSIHSPVVTTIPTTTKGSIDNRQVVCYRHLLIGSFGTKRVVRSNSNAVRFKPVRFNAQASATIGLQPAETKTKDGEKDENLIFVAGATGKVGSRTVRELLKLGFNVRAGVRSTQRAESLVKSVQQMKLDDGSQPVEKLQLVECDLEKPEQIKPALGNASTVICTIGASEKEIFDVTGPYRIDFQATKNLIDAAAAAKAKHFILVTSLGTNKFGFPAAVLNLFWGVLCWKRKAEEALLASGIPYTIVRPGGMERPTDSFKETHNLTLSLEDTLFGGLVSNLQVAELLAFMAKNHNLSYCNVVEVVAETTAPLTPMGDLLTKIPPQRPIPPQPKEPEPEVIKKPEPVSKSTIIETSSVATEPQVESKIASSRPLSPYTAYEGLRPPSSPTPSPPGGSKAVVEAVSAPSTVPETSTEVETVTITTEPPPVAAELPKPRPLSPYTAYEGLKPPSSPTPSGGSKAAVEAVSAPSTVPETSTPVDTITFTFTTEPPPVAAELPKTRPLSPYTAYENLKPPSSPSPSKPSVSPPPASIVDNGSPIASTPEVDNSDHSTVKPRPLSPYPMYENLKPPSSPTPSAPK
ncbi:protein TIC 62, chloroplastic-like isoform X2 [Bidens hawaiensis]|uniref:protein TIC 62, chloroplastic-like isoform X2 n=1 Tax=Bidens hawaiensis TaxID=980011 RepID=UPI00404B3C2D